MESQSIGSYFSFGEGKFIVITITNPLGGCGEKKDCKEKEEKQLAMKYLNERKVMVEDLKKVQAGKSRVGTKIPEYKFEDYTHLTEVHFKGKIPPEVLELAIVKRN